MSILDAIILGIVQGLTEFLPVSSSGHLVIARMLGLGGAEADRAFAVLLHVATLCAIIIIMRKDIRACLTEERNLLWPIAVTTVVTVAIALPLNKNIKKIFENPAKAAIILMITFAATAALILIGEYCLKKRPEKKETVSIGMSVVVGLFQGMAVFPGISRSGATIAGGSILGRDRQTSVRYAFLIAIPVILGALVLDIKDIVELKGFAAPALGFAAAFVSGYAALKLLFRLARTRYYFVFAIYTIMISLGLLVYRIANGH